MRIPEVLHIEANKATAASLYYFIALQFITLSALTIPSIGRTQDWGEMAMVSATMGINANRVCVGEASRGDLGCPIYAPTVSPTGNVGISAGLTVNAVSLTTAGTTWGYFGSAASYIPNLNTNNISLSTINGVSITNLGGASPTNVPSFHIHRNAVNQTVTANLNAAPYNKIVFTTKSFDPLNSFNTSLSRFQPSVAGNYLLILKTYCPNSNRCSANLSKNGYQISRGQVGNTGIGDTAVITYMNGSSDYAEAGVDTDVTSLAGSPDHTYFAGSLLASGNGMVSGTGSSSLSGMSDVALTSPVTGQVLTYNGSQWVNSAPAAANTISGTSTIIPNWPDALRCNITTPNSGPRIIPLSYAPWVDGRYFYRTHNGFNEYIGLIFNADG